MRPFTLRSHSTPGCPAVRRRHADTFELIEILPGGVLLTIRGKTGWREVEIGRGSRSDTCPVALLETWMRLGRIARGPLFRAITRKAAGIGSERLTDKHVVRLVKRCALAAGLRGDLPEGERRLAFAGHSVRAGLASLTVSIASSSTTVVGGPTVVFFYAGDSQAQASFWPTSAGATTLSIQAPPGFTTPSSGATATLAVH